MFPVANRSRLANRDEFKDPNASGQDRLWSRGFQLHQPPLQAVQAATLFLTVKNVVRLPILFKRYDRYRKPQATPVQFPISTLRFWPGKGLHEMANTVSQGQYHSSRSKNADNDRLRDGAVNRNKRFASTEVATALVRRTHVRGNHNDNA